MIVVRDTFQAKYGKGNELVALFKEFGETWPQYGHRILTDLSGPFFTVVAESEVESLAAWETTSEELFADPKFADWFDRMTPLVKTGKREFFHLE
jgi:hypothetical protein